ncbi:MAG: cyclopropane-fatty-acyl-phospholipid synthase [Planctomycetota bacterium]|nr:cyclopropane-fatty-acyl-phospholipid synthase [Planctomycetota bacterium]
MTTPMTNHDTIRALAAAPAPGRAAADPANPAGAFRERSLGFVDRWARKAVLAQLGALAQGQVTLEEPWGRQSFGQASGGGAGQRDGQSGGQTDNPATLAATLRVLAPGFYRRATLGGSLGAADAYIRGEWACDDLVALFRILLRNLPAADDLDTGLARLRAPLARLAHALRANTRDGSARNIHAHYDLGNDFFALFLDETMSYSSGIFERPDATLRDASVAKIDRLCRKLELRPEDHILEIGTGWGALAIHAAKNFGCRVTTTTISAPQRELALARIKAAGLEGRIEVLLRDYRDLRGQYDKLVSVEMIEAVGHRFLPTYFGACARLLKPQGVMALQAITMPDHRYEDYRRQVDFIQAYIFPGSCVPSTAAMTNAIARASDFRVLHLEDFGLDYARTLREWRTRFCARLDEVRAQGYTDAFIRMWEYYLCYCEAGFAERYTGVAQIVLGRPGARREADKP